MGRNVRDGSEWCILTTAGVRTIPLARSLAASGIEAWTPTRMMRRQGRGKQRKQVVEVELPITPTFVFVRASSMPDIFRILRLPTSPHPSFRIMRHGDRIPEVRDSGLNSLRAAEDRFRQSALKSVRRHVKPGTQIKLKKGAFAGMTGIVEASTGKEAKVNFGGGFTVSIASYLIGTDVVQDGPQPLEGIAA